MRQVIAGRGVTPPRKQRLTEAPGRGKLAQGDGCRAALKLFTNSVGFYMAKDSENKVMHLYRGAPAVRSWSKHQEIVESWALCGVKREPRKVDDPRYVHATEESAKVTCPFCLDLMSPKSYDKPYVRV